MIQGWWMLFLAGVLSLSVHAAPDSGRAPEVVPGEFLVQYRKSFGILATQKLALKTKMASLASVRAIPGLNDVELFKVRKGQSADLALEMLQADSNVEIAEPNYVYRRFQDSEQPPVEEPPTAEPPAGPTLPSDTDFAKLWGLQNLGQIDPATRPADQLMGIPGTDIGAVPVWDSGVRGSRRMVVAVIDTGIDWTHPDLQANIFTNPGEIPDNNIDDDRNGFVDDVHGWNFYANNKNSSDDHNHGTHCAGTIGAVGNNGVGVTGINWEVTLLPVKFLSAQGSGSAAGSIAAVRYATRMGAKVMSNSWGGGGASEILKTAIQEARDAGILFVAAAGNDGRDNDTTATYPANYDVSNVVSVGAMDNRGGRAYFSNWGLTKVHLFAPGMNIWSTYKNGLYGVMSGTSMATPHVAGAAALLWAHEPNLSMDQVKQRLISTVQPTRIFKTRSISGGRLSLVNAIQNYIPTYNPTLPDPTRWTSVDMALERRNIANNVDETFEIVHPTARFVRIRFASLDLDNMYDRLTLSEASTYPVEILTGRMRSAFTSAYYEGDRVVFRLRTDNATRSSGFTILGYDWQ